MLRVLFGSVIQHGVGHNNTRIAFTMGVPLISMVLVLLREIPLIYMDCQQLLPELWHTRQFSTYLAQLVKAVISYIKVLPATCLI